MDYLKRGLRRTVASIKNHKILFGAIILLQLLFLVLFLSAAIYYQVKLMEDASGIIEPLEKANYDAEQIQGGTPFTEDFLGVFNSYNSLVQNFKEFVVTILLLFLFVNGAIWMLSHWLLEEKINWKQKPKKAFRFFVKITVSTAALFGPFLILGYLLAMQFIRTAASLGEITVVIGAILAFSPVVYYFLLVAFAAAHHKSWKKFARDFFALSILKIKWTAAVFGINVALMLVNVAALYAAVWFGRSAILLFLAGIMLVVSMTMMRIFFIACLQEIGHETDNN